VIPILWSHNATLYKVMSLGPRHDHDILATLSIKLFHSHSAITNIITVQWILKHPSSLQPFTYNPSNLCLERNFLSGIYKPELHYVYSFVMLIAGQQVGGSIMSKQKSFLKHLLFVTFSLGKFFTKVFDNVT